MLNGQSKKGLMSRPEEREGAARKGRWALELSKPTAQTGGAHRRHPGRFHSPRTWTHHLRASSLP